MDLLAARDTLAQSLPNSKSTNDDQDIKASISDALRLSKPQLLP